MKNNFLLVNADTDSITVCKPDMAEFTKEEQERFLSNLNSQMPERIRWEDDGLFSSMVVLKAKNYILYDGKKIKIKGSALKSSKTEKGMKEFLEKVIDCLVFDKQEQILGIYEQYIKEAHNLKDITRWSSKKTISEAVLEAKQTTQQKILEAVGDRHVQLGDKIYVYFRKDGSLGMQEDWDQDHNPDKLAERVYKTLTIFSNVIDMNLFVKYHLKTKKEQLCNLLGIAYEKPVKKKKEKVDKRKEMKDN